MAPSPPLLYAFATGFRVQAVVLSLCCCCLCLMFSCCLQPWLLLAIVPSAARSYRAEPLSCLKLVYPLAVGSRTNSYEWHT